LFHSAYQLCRPKSAAMYPEVVRHSLFYMSLIGREILGLDM